jgi:hypothetical protein
MPTTIVAATCPVPACNLAPRDVESLVSGNLFGRSYRRVSEAGRSALTLRSAWRSARAGF